MRMRFMTLEDATLAGASMSDLGQGLELEVALEGEGAAPWLLADTDD
ncbi:hypothetical protein [Streptomyces sirii]